MKTRIIRTTGSLAAILLSLLTAAAVPAASAAEPVAEKIIVKDSFNAGRENWEWSGSINQGGLILTAPNAKQWAGAQTLLKTSPTLPASEAQALRLHLTIEQLDNAAEGKTNAEARLFFLPAPLKNPSFADPFGEPDALTLLISANTDRGTLSLNLFRKTGQAKGGYGDKLYEATLPLGSFPLTLDWYLSLTGYKLNLTPKAQSVDGSREGAWTLAGTPLAGQLRYVMRAVNIADNVQSRLRLSDFSLTHTTIPE
ncbi:hypothetical protein [Geminisphaera colitermitum]|uniref:hypothetical protein n=1 Tax=Geminisphaera colitermitum TaxID=1148786 RepID=UPI000158C577|nr:hypothetical protein [Geminisphaera colitermitum]